ncbi:M14 family metallopeptidase [Asticcacaulis endophyticus]|uniref:Peptidase n=1 Tax=Asticcacaulis endophyticus TaxID=1395890 RepID=A0A918Q4S4_9CAUL|nr:M14 metallopeptidase family protein [Asticcacaulis endophyticus]GGZ30796.1 peptidase [Asticcacaulis endophyticus]
MLQRVKLKTYAMLAASVLALATAPIALADVPTAASVIGFTPGDDYKLANYQDSIKYFKALAASSDSIKMVEAGKSTQGRVMEYAVISSPANLAKLDHYIDISKKLSGARGLTDEQAKLLAKDGKVIIHIDGGMHASEVADHQLPLALAYKLLSSPNDPEVQAILDNVILVLWPTLNPDGQDMVVDWYRKNLGTKYETSRMPYLYQDYVGHDNNRDGYMLNMKESRVATKAARDYDPVIWYSQHQVAPFPARIWMPPFADPVSSNISPYMRIWTSAIGTNMMARFEFEQKPGAIAQARFDNWYAGFLDYTHVFRNTISFFTEVAHDSATPKVYDPKDFPKKTQDFKAQIMYPNPWKGGLWRLKDSVDYMMTASMSVLDTGVRYKEVLLYNRYQAGRDNIKKFPSEGLHAYVIPAGQTDMGEAAELTQKFIDLGVEVHQAKSEITLGGKTYPAGSFVLLTDQPFSGLIPELLGIQKYPDAILAGDGTAAELPYDTTGWTLPLQMGVTAEAVNAPVGTAERGQLAKITTASAPAGAITGKGSRYVLSRKVNASYAATNDVIKAGGKLAYAKSTGDFVVTGLKPAAMQTIASKHKLAVTTAAFGTGTDSLKPARIGMYRPWGSNMDEGWTRWILEQYNYGLTSVYNGDVKAGALDDKFDTIILPDMGGRRTGALKSLKEGLSAEDTPADYAGGIGEEGAEALKGFVSEGGTLVVMNNTSDAIIELFDLPVTNVLKDVKPEVFFCAGALLEVELGEASEVTAGLSAKPIIMFQGGPAFEVKDGFKGKVLASYAKDASPLRSGVIHGPETIQGKAAALEVEYGKGKILLYGFEPQWRGQTHNTYKFVFNSFYK